MTMQVDKARLDATYTHEASEAGHLYYVTLGGRSPAPYTEQRHVHAILDIASDGTLAGVELIDNMPPPPLRSTEGKEEEPVAWQWRSLPEGQWWFLYSEPEPQEDIEVRPLYTTPEAEEAHAAKLREALEAWSLADEGPVSGTADRKERARELTRAALTRSPE